MEKNYLIILDENGKRITSLVVGIHANTIDELIAFAQQHYSNYTYVVADDELQNQLLDSQARYINNEIVIVDEQVAESKADLIKRLKKSIDEKATNIKNQWYRFMDEYTERERAAREFKQNNYSGTPDVILTDFSNAASIDYKTAADIVLQQAEIVRSNLTKIAGLRMRKFALNEKMTEQELKDMHDDVIRELEKFKE
ncbi:hypothetical protein CEP49_06825 [Mergibacter septicus]|uniref:hypothetical protein n=1 Tax=Mergibacter septicus TaxID=221402 RepID=UPI0011795976|nr:hypothetical protein [Mergibacter septicus]AWX14282.1 hypothetical protein CEP49_06825 [Mergibacter septicus]